MFKKSVLPVIFLFTLLLCACSGANQGPLTVEPQTTATLWVGNVLHITDSGTYTLRGTLDEGQILIEADKADEVVLVLDGVTIKNTTTAPLVVDTAERVTLTLAKDSYNKLEDTADRGDPDDPESKKTAVIHASDDLVINGEGTLEVVAGYNNGIRSKNSVDIESGTVIVTARNHGIRGTDDVTIKGGTVTVTSGNDGLKSDNITEPERGFVLIDGGTVTINATGDGIQSDNFITIANGDVTVNATRRGLKAEAKISLHGGKLTVTAKEETFDCNIIDHTGTELVTE